MLRLKSLSPETSGLLLIEILLAVALMSLITLAVLSSFAYGRDSTAIAGDRARAVEIANESVEAVQNIAQDSFANLSGYSDGTTYYLDTSGTSWALTTTPTTINTIYTPTIVFSNGPGTDRQVTLSVTWPENIKRTGTITITTYLSDWQAPTAYLPPGPDLNSSEAGYHV